MDRAIGCNAIDMASINDEGLDGKTPGCIKPGEPPPLKVVTNTRDPWTVSSGATGAAGVVWST
jgi:hypothetical protein